MKVSIYSREEIEKLISKGFPEKTAVISFYDPPNIRTGEISEPVDYKGLPERVFQVEVHDIDMETLEDLVCRLIRISRKRIVLRRLYKRLMMTASI